LDDTAFLQVLKGCFFCAIAGTKDIYQVVLHELGELLVATPALSFSNWMLVGICHAVMYEYISMLICLLYRISPVLCCVDLTSIFSGHAIGMDHSAVENAIMAPRYQFYKAILPLTQDDIDGCKVTRTTIQQQIAQKPIHFLFLYVWPEIKKFFHSFLQQAKYGA
jgi:hypothetical protein